MNALSPADLFNFAVTLWPELALVVAACVLFLLGLSPRPGARRAAAAIALVCLAILFVVHLLEGHGESATVADRSVVIGEFSHFIKLVASGIGVMLVLLAWPTSADATGN